MSNPFSIDKYARPNLELHNGEKRLLLHSGCAPFAVEIMEAVAISKNETTVFFYNPNNLDEEKNNFFKIINCGKVIQNNNVKTFVRPKFVETFCIHRIGSGKKSMKISEGVIYFNHYFFLNKLNRGREKTKLKDCSILNKIKNFNIHLE